MWTFGKGAPLPIDGAPHLALPELRLLGDWTHAEDILAKGGFITKPYFPLEPYLFFFSDDLGWAI